ncbi:MAG: hypothetical protein IJW13_00020 [Clostridia bacterium]|nr:hypothetical protein [Clostridia bacterium]
MKKQKFKIGLISTLLTAVLLVGFLLPSYIEDNSDLPVENVAMQTVYADAVYETTVEDEIEAFLSVFDSYEYIVDEEQQLIIVRETMQSGEVTEIYETYINYGVDASLTFPIITYIQSGEDIVESEIFVAVPYYDEEDDEFYIDIDGELISVNDVINGNYSTNSRMVLEGVLSSSLLIAAAYLATTAVIVCYPYIKTVVTTVTTMVTTFLSSFFSWIKNVFTSIFVTKTEMTQVLCYRLTVFDREFELEKVTTIALEVQIENEYYLAIVMSSDVYISAQSITEQEAITVLSTSIPVLVNGAQFSLNTYTVLEMDALYVAEQAAVRQGLVGAKRHGYHNDEGEKSGVYFQHYHPGKDHTPHSFFGAPAIT